MAWLAKRGQRQQRDGASVALPRRNGSWRGAKLTLGGVAGFLPRRPDSKQNDDDRQDLPAPEVEGRIYADWEQAGAFRAGRPERAAAKPYCIVIPPPNVTGSLHMGHALNNTLQDILCRFERMRGKDVLWQPGTDHAGIATQMVVERQLMERQEPGRREMGREVPRSASGRGRRRAAAPSSTSSSGSAPRATGRASASPWTRGCRAPSSKCSSSSIDEGLIYKDKRLVNWDPKLLTAISDLEVHAGRGQRPSLAHRVSDRGQDLRSGGSSTSSSCDHAAGDDAGRHRGRGASGRRAATST